MATAALGLASVLAARELGPDGRGVLAMEVTITTLLAILLTGGIYLAARVALVAPGAGRLDLGDYLGLCIAVVLAQAGLCTVASFTVLPLAGVDLTLLDGGFFVVHGMVTASAILAINLAYTYGRFATAAFSEAVGSVAALVVTAILVVRHDASPTAYLAALAVGALLQAIVAMAMIEQRARPTLAPATWRGLVRSAVAGTGIGVAQAATYRFDRYLVGLLASPAAAGLYSVAATGAELVRLVSSSLGQIALQHAARDGAVPRDHVPMRAIAISTALAVLLAMTVSAPWLLRTILGAPYEPAADTLRLLLLAEVFTASFLIDSAVLSGLGRLARASSISIIGFVIITGLDAVAIPALNAEGAALASIAAYGAMAVLAWRAVSSARAAQPPLAASEGDTPRD